MQLVLVFLEFLIIDNSELEVYFLVRANLRGAALSHPCDRGIPFILNITNGPAPGWPVYRRRSR